MKVSISKDKSTLLIELPIVNPPKPSKTGRTLLVATTGGNKDSGVIVNGKQLMVGVNAYVYAIDKGEAKTSAAAAE